MIEIRRLELHEILCDLLGSRNVYFQPPESVRMSYPAIVYSRDSIQTIHADDSIYRAKSRYSITVIDQDSDSQYIEQMMTLPLCRFDRGYQSDNLNHYVFTVYY